MTFKCPCCRQWKDMSEFLNGACKNCLGLPATCKNCGEKGHANCWSQILPDERFLPPGRYYDSNHMHWPTDYEIKIALKKEDRWKKIGEINES